MSKTVKLQHPKEKNKTKEIHTDGFNLGGLILGPLLYIGWGMWKKGLVLIGVMLLLFIIQDIVFEMAGQQVSQSILGNLVMIYCAFAINKDNYNNLLNNGWKQVGEAVKTDEKSKKRNLIAWIIFGLLMLVFSLALIAGN